MNLSERRLTAELLDQLPADDPAAIRSRRDLRLINRLMGNFGWLRWQLREGLSRFDSRPFVVELGAGCGTFALSVSEMPIDYAAIDLIPQPGNWPRDWRWCQGDLFHWYPQLQTDIVVANLFLHHFPESSLADLGRLIRSSSCRVILLNEPSRHAMHLYQGKLLRLAGINAVTRHDMDVSIRSGFRDDELAEALELDRAEWSWRVTRTWLGAYRLIATR